MFFPAIKTLKVNLLVFDYKLRHKLSDDVLVHLILWSKICVITGATIYWDDPFLLSLKER